MSEFRPIESEITRRKSAPQRNTPVSECIREWNSHLKVEPDANNNSARNCCSNGSVRKRDVVFALLHAFTAIALIHAYTHINYRSANNKDAGQGFSAFIFNVDPSKGDKYRVAHLLR